MHHQPPIVGYNYICFGSNQVQEMTQRGTAEVVLAEPIQAMASATIVYEVFFSEQPETCAVLTEVGSELIPGAILVAVTWSRPLLVQFQPSKKEKK